MQHPSRRQFVAASFAGAPLLAYAGWAAPLQNGAARQQPTAVLDPVLEQINASLRELVAEGEAKPANRREVTRALEATLGVQAAHIAHHYDARIKQALVQWERRDGRAALVEQLVAAARQKNLHDVTHERMDDAVSRLARHGLSGCIRDGQRIMRAIRLRSPAAVQAASLVPAQYDFCSDLAWMIELTTMVIAITCVLSVSPAFPLALPACWAAEAYMLGLLLLKAWYC